MKDKLKLYGPIIILALLFYMIVNTPHSRPLGDIILESIGLNSWTSGNQGIHVALVYFSILFIVVLVLSNKFLGVEPNRYRVHKIIAFICSVTIIYLIHSAIVYNMMENSEGLNSIALAESGVKYRFNTRDDEIIEFQCEFDLTNYSKEAKQFTILSIDEGRTEFEVYNKQGEVAIFGVPGKGTCKYRIDLNNYTVKIIGYEKYKITDGNGTISSLLLLDENGNRIKIVKLRDRWIDDTF